MAKKDKMVDFPEYDPHAKVPFPPGPKAQAPASPFGKTPARREKQAPEKQPYYQNYTPDPPAPDPSQTVPGMPDVRDPATKLPEGADLGKLSPDVDLKE